MDDRTTKPSADNPQALIGRRQVLAGIAALSTAGVPAFAHADDLSAEMILNDPDAPVGGNPAGSLTIVTFFDYNCPFCKSTVEPLGKVLKSDGDIRLVYKDWPILFPTSPYAARLALAAKHQNRYEEAYAALMGIDGPRVSEDRMREALRAGGFDLAQLEATAEKRKTEISTLLERNNAQAERLGLRGTPAFLIGRYIVASALDEAGFREVVAEARKAS